MYEIIDNEAKKKREKDERDTEIGMQIYSVLR